MADYPIPPWLHPYGDPGELYLQSQRLNAGVQEAQQRLQADREQAAMAAQIRRDAINQRALEEEQRIQIEQARLDAYSGLRAQAIGIAKQKADQTAAIAARQFAAQQSFSQRIAAEGPENAAKIALSTPGLGLSGAGIASLSRAATPKPNIAPTWTIDPETQKLIPYNARTGQPHPRAIGRAEIPDNLTPRERARISFLKSELPRIDKDLGEGLSKRAEDRTDAQIKALPKDEQDLAYTLRQKAQDKRAARNHIADELERLTGERAPSIPTEVQAVPTGVQTGTIKMRKVARANELAKLHPDWTKEKILKQVNDEIK